MSPLQLSDGTRLAPGQYICMPAGPMAGDASFFPDPERFDGNRYYQHERYSDDDNYHENDKSQHCFAGIEPYNIHWGNGRFTCPGRWYASAVMKVSIATILLKYDIAFPEGQTERPENVCLDDEIIPDTKQNIRLKLRA